MKDLGRKSFAIRLSPLVIFGCKGTQKKLITKDYQQIFSILTKTFIGCPQLRVKRAERNCGQSFS